MALGAVRSGSRAQMMLVVLYLTALALILVVPPSAEVRVPLFAKVGQEYFGNVGPAFETGKDQPRRFDRR